MKTCWYENVCSTVTNNCRTGCIRYLEMLHLCEQSNIPENRWYPITMSPDKCDYDAFCDLADIKDEIGNFVKRGSNLYLYSTKTGNGKTTWYDSDGNLDSISDTPSDWEQDMNNEGY